MQPRTLLERNQGILDRLANLQAIEPRLRRIFVEGKREHLLQGLDAQGLRFRPLAASTLARREGQGPPLAPRFASSEIVAAYAVNFAYPGHTVIVSAGWPMEWVRYHVTGGARLPRRNPGGFRRQDVQESTRVIREYLFRG